MIDDNLSVLPDGLRMLLQRLDERGVVVVDVREPDEFADWSIANSVNIPLTDFNFVGKVEKLVGGRPIVTICTRGNRSIYAAEVLQEGGMQARSLEGGLVAWSKIHICAEVRVPQFGDTKILQIRRLLRGCTSYIVAGKTDCAVFDPSSDAAQYTSIASKYGFRITHVVDTHQHADHISGARTLANETGAKLHLSAHEEYEFDGFEPVEEGSTISLNRGGLAIEAIDTPGHTVGSACFLIEKRALISGDTLFLEGVGRPDLNGKAEQRARDLYRSCRSVFSRLDPEVLVLPGHFDLATNTMEERPLWRTLTEIDDNVGLTSTSEAEFVEALLTHERPPPSNYQSIIKINRGERPLDPSLIDLLEEGHNRCILPVRPQQ